MAKKRRKATKRKRSSKSGSSGLCRKLAFQCVNLCGDYPEDFEIDPMMDSSARHQLCKKKCRACHKGGVP